MQQMWKFVGIIVFSIAFGMVLTLLISNRLAGLIVAACITHLRHKKRLSVNSIPNSDSLVFVSIISTDLIAKGLIPRNIIPWEIKSQETVPFMLFLLCRT